ncbi:cell wall hydrolase [Thermodesulforhabdus norvegica]|nr:cell wall hydrolase [Thermodesulforhabdus norvegica]
MEGRAELKDMGFAIRDWYVSEDARYMAATIYGEARGESLEGQVAVAFVIRNRSATRNMTPREVVLQPFQFSCWNPYDPNRPICEQVVDRWDEMFRRLRGVRQCWWVAVGVMAGLLCDPTNGATHYLTKRLYFSELCPDWAHRLTERAHIGKHIFLGEA